MNSFKQVHTLHSCREGSSKPILPLKPRISNWNSSGEHTATKASQKMTESKPNILTGNYFLLLFMCDNVQNESLLSFKLGKSTTLRW